MPSTRCPAGGTFTFSAAAEGDRVVIRAADGGCGMSEETRRRVFEPFFTTKGAQGNGLGLAVVWGIVARHGGEIAVDSVLGRGTTFTIRLPVPAVLPVDQGTEGGLRLPPGRRVLVVEDNQEILRSLGDVLRDNGCEVVEAPNGATALARLEAEGRGPGPDRPRHAGGLGLGGRLGLPGSLSRDPGRA